MGSPIELGVLKLTGGGTCGLVGFLVENDAAALGMSVDGFENVSL